MVFIITKSVEINNSYYPTFNYYTLEHPKYSTKKTKRDHLYSIQNHSVSMTTVSPPALGTKCVDTPNQSDTVS